MRETRRWRRHAIGGALGSFAIHALLAAIAFWPVGAERPAAAADVSSALNGADWPAAGWNHLWQSTVFAFAVGLLTIAFRKNQARVRYWLWFGASVKFVIPFSILMMLGSLLPGASIIQTIATPMLSLTTADIIQPPLEGASSGSPAPLSPPPSADWAFVVVVGLWACGLAVMVLMRSRIWWRVRRIVRGSTAVEIPYGVLPPGVEVRAVPGLLEPGVVGFWRPVLLLPVGIEAYLTAAQLQAVLAHELCHIKRRDNLTAAVHMIVESVFWFHPLVWWIGARLVDEREAACDEEVLRLGNEPHVYAQSILRTCEFYVESPLLCVSGVTGSG